jgi:phage baseplate assembly protein W|tara:strand:+ start:175 stop:603 length:429 start_codon:yes stop_codon:yes gene_type:complete
MASYDSGSITNKSKRSARIYSDLNLDFQQNTATKDIQKMSDVEAVKRSVRNLINLNHYEKPFHPEIGSNLRAMLFENITPQMTHVISKEIDNLIRNYEPRARLVQISTMPQFDKNAYAATISFYVQNSPDRIVVESFLERLR